MCNSDFATVHGYKKKPRITRIVFGQRKLYDLIFLKCISRRAAEPQRGEEKDIIVSYLIWIISRMDNITVKLSSERENRRERLRKRYIVSSLS